MKNILILTAIILSSCTQQIIPNESFTTRSILSGKDEFNKKMVKWEINDTTILMNNNPMKTNGTWVIKYKPDQKIFHYLVETQTKDMIYEVKIGRETTVTTHNVIGIIKDLSNKDRICYINSVR